jgi:hypothetical protein
LPRLARGTDSGPGKGAGQPVDAECQVSEGGVERSIGVDADGVGNGPVQPSPATVGTVRRWAGGGGAGDEFLVGVVAHRDEQIPRVDGVGQRAGAGPADPKAGMFGVPEFARILEQVVTRYGITVHFNSEIVEVDPDAREVILRDNTADTKQRIGYDTAHLVPPRSAPDGIKAGPLADPANPAGYIEVDKHTLQHVRTRLRRWSRTCGRC